MVKIIRQAIYRVWQFLQALSAHLREEDFRVLKENLTPEELGAFSRMPPADQRHSLDVYYTLVRAGKTHPELLKAALLHDIGKAEGEIRLWHRVAIVLIRAVFPRALKWLAVPNGWRYPFYVHYYHPVLGAEMARKLGCSPLTVELILRHQPALELPPWDPSPEEMELLRALQEVDGTK